MTNSIQEFDSQATLGFWFDVTRELQYIVQGSK